MEIESLHIFTNTFSDRISYLFWIIHRCNIGKARELWEFIKSHRKPPLGINRDENWEI